MSEYQYIEFRAIDRPLDRKQMEELRRISSRAEITSSSFTNTYNFGDFKGDPSALMDRYFDAFVYVANWGTRQLMLRIPRSLIDVEAARAYCDGEVLGMVERPDHVVLEFLSEDEPGDMEDGSLWMPSLVSIRGELMRGDSRALYLGWLASFYARGWFDEDAELDGEFEPPPPPGLRTLSAPLQALAEFLRVDEGLLDAAAAGSPDEPAAPLREELLRWIKKLPPSEKDAYLLRLIDGSGDGTIQAELSARFHKAVAAQGRGEHLAAGRRSVADLIAAQNGQADAAFEKAARKAADELARRDREEAAEKSARLDELARRESATWSDVEALIASNRSNEYDQAVALLVGLRELAGRAGRAETEKFLDRVREIRERNASRRALLKRMNEEHLGG